jgi:secretion/DNA translocation related CpaE-like protein
LAVRSDPPSRQAWQEAGLVVLGAELVDRIVAAGLPRREGVLVVGSSDFEPDLLERCLRVGAERVLVLPNREDELVAALSELGTGGPGDGLVLAVVGARGGAGASVFAVAMALAGQHSTRPVVLADLDPWSPGLDLVLGVEAGRDTLAVGRPPQGRLPAGTLLRALPSVRVGRGRLSVLLPSRTTGEPVDTDLLAAVLSAGRRAGALIVVDVPRHPWPAADLSLESADLSIMVVPSDVQGCFGGVRVAARLSDLGASIGLVVRGPSPGGIGPSDVATALSAPMLARMRPEPGLERRIEEGRPPGENARGPLGRAARTVLGSAGVLV